MNVNAVGPSDSTDIRKAAIEAAMINKEPTAQERAVEMQRKLLNRICGTEDSGMLRDAIKPADLASLFTQIKSQADRIAEFEKDAKRLDWILPILSLTNDTPRIMDERALAMARQFMKIPPFTGREAIDAAMNEKMQQADPLQVFLPYVWTGTETFYQQLKGRGFKALPESTQ